MILHPRSDWYANPAKWQAHAWFDSRGVVGIAWHYPGAPHLRLLGVDDLYQEADTVAMLRAMDNDYLTTRGYNLGYSFVIDPAGEVWTVRGLTDRPASNGSVITNSAYAGVLFLVPDLTSAPGPAQLDAARQLVAHVRAWAPGAVVNIPHSQLYTTACPGDTIRGLLAQLEPAAPTTPPTLTIGDDDMPAAKFRHPDYANVFIVPECTPESPGVDAAFSALPLIEHDAHDPLLAACVYRSWGITAPTTADAIKLARDGGFLVPLGPH